MTQTARQVIVQAYGKCTAKNVYEFLRENTDLSAMSSAKLAGFMGQWHEASLDTVAKADQIDHKNAQAEHKSSPQTTLTPEQATKE